jgi:hypothetical protein
LLRRDQESTAIAYSCFSEGAAGLAQFYLSLYAYSRNEAYRKAYYAWMEYTLQVLHRDLSVGYYCNQECNLHNGLIGVDLTLLSYVTTARLNWSRYLLL